MSGAVTKQIHDDIITMLNEPDRKRVTSTELSDKGYDSKTTRRVVKKMLKTNQIVRRTELKDARKYFVRLPISNGE